MSVESCTGKRNLEIPLDISREKSTGKFYIVGSEGFHEMHKRVLERDQYNQKMAKIVIYHLLTSF